MLMKNNYCNWSNKKINGIFWYFYISTISKSQLQLHINISWSNF